MGSTSQTGYECIDELIVRLRAEGHIEPAQRLHTLLHEVGWTTSSELIGELGLAILAFERSKPAASPELRRLLDSCMSAVRKQWPDIQ